ncbi:MAG TPA: tannase/feruloyl esterase family alpha/beta hydrolase [Bacteroidales bacterium]|nr:tannase/feruloyl esterase family alpha/beta hydrolase [Bacteroidales bacterium]
MKKTFYSFISVLLITKALASGQAEKNITITSTDLTKVGTSIPASDIGEPVSSVKLYDPRWVEATSNSPAYAVVEGSIFPVDENGYPINFRVLLPANWSRRSIQSGGGGMNGSITVREGRNPLVAKGFVNYGSDSGHQAGGMPGMPGQGGGASNIAKGPGSGNEWALNDEAIRNLGYMQMKKTHDAAMVIIKRLYGELPAYNYYQGASQGGREGLAVAQRYPKDYNGILSDVPIVSFSNLMLAPELIRIQEIPLNNWVPATKTNAVRAEFLRQCDNLDGISDGIINNYVDARALFDVTDGVGPADPWAALRVSSDPDPKDATVSAKLTDGMIKTLEFVYSPYKFKEPLAFGTKSFGMWIPNVEPDGFGLISGERYKGQEGAPENAQVHSNLGVLGVTGFLMHDINGNPLDYKENAEMLKRRKQLSEWLDATNPDLSEFYKNGGKIIMTVGTNDNIASSGAQLDYYQSLINAMGEKKLDQFARMFVVPQAGHGLSGRSYSVNGEGKPVEVKQIPSPNGDDKLDLLISWVEKNQSPAKTLIIDDKGRIKKEAEGKGYLLCSYPQYPKYTSGPTDQVSSYVSAAPAKK